MYLSVYVSTLKKIPHYLSYLGEFSNNPFSTTGSMEHNSRELLEISIDAQSCLSVRHIASTV